MAYRLNYGNGQVSNTMSSLKEAKEAYRAQVEFDTRARQSSAHLTIQRYIEDGFWKKVVVPR